MSIAAGLILAAAVAAQPPSDEPRETRTRGVQVESARVTVRILRAAVLTGGEIGSTDAQTAPRVQTLEREGRVTYEFE